MMDGASKTVDHQLETVLPYAESSAAGDRYFRLQPPLTPNHAEMSDAGEDNMSALKKIADDYLADPQVKTRLDALCQKLLDDPPPHPMV
jgi:hypothetical protein